MTVLEVIQRTTSFLTKKGVDSPRLQAELLLAHVLQLPRMQLYLNFERVLAPAEQDASRQFVIRRGEREPLQHILGSACFCGLELTVNKQVLIPRPETELLAERGWKFLNHQLKATVVQFASEPGSGPQAPEPSALDFGTGSGCLAIALAVNCPGALITAVDLSPAALEIAKANSFRHGVADRILFLPGNGFAPLPGQLRFDLILSNPPYIPTAELDTLQPEVRDFDPRMALDGGPDGLKFHRQLALESGEWLKPGGKLMLEFGDGQERAVAELFERENWIVEEIVPDYTQRPRLLLARKRV